MSSYFYFTDKKVHPMLENDYPYTSGAKGDDTTNCLYSAIKATNVTVESYEVIQKTNNEDDTQKRMKAALQKQPLAVALAANNKYIHSYANGIIDSEDCYTP